MSDPILATIISAAASIIVALIGLIPLYFPRTKGNGKVNRDGQGGQKGRTRSGGKWVFPVLMGLIVGVTIFVVIITVQNKGASETPPMMPLSGAKVEFKILVDGNQIIIPAGGAIDSLHQGDQITIETRVTDEKGSPYSGELAFLYYFASGGDFTGKIAPYLVQQSDTITVRIEDQMTREVILRSIFVRPD